MEIEIKDFKESDAEAVCAMMHELAAFHGDTIATTKDDFIQNSLDNGLAKTWVAFQGDEAVGFATAYDRFHFVDCVMVRMLDLLYVAESYRGNGIGLHLLKHVQEDCKRSGVARLNVTASMSNEKANLFYAQNGFSFHEPTANRYQMELE